MSNQLDQLNQPDQPKGTAPYVFLSYASADRERALDIADRLEATGVPVWIDRHSIAGGISWSAAIVDGIKGCTALAVLCTPAAMRSRNVRQEIQLAWEFDRPALPLLLEPVEYPPEVAYALAGRQWIEILDRPAEAWLPAALQALARLGVVASVAGGRDAAPSSPPAGSTGEAVTAVQPAPGTAAAHLVVRSRSPMAASIRPARLIAGPALLVALVGLALTAAILAGPLDGYRRVWFGPLLISALTYLALVLTPAPRRTSGSPRVQQAQAIRDRIASKRPRAEELGATRLIDRFLATVDRKTLPELDRLALSNRLVREHL